jgi:hypothetical protein
VVEEIIVPVANSIGEERTESLPGYDRLATDITA